MQLPDAAQIRAILLDIEGTTTPVSFVYEVLFPYARQHLREFLQGHSENAEVNSLISALERQRASDLQNGLEPPGWFDNSKKELVESAASYAAWLMDRDSKCTPLKSLQGRIWQEGYQTGRLRGQVFADVPPAFERWRRQDRRLFIYSSGSVLAQKLLFQSTEFGDLTLKLDGFFDTEIGNKTDAQSYTRIAASIGSEPSQILFISDAVKELQAAHSVGVNSILCVRESQETSAADVPAVHTFDDIFPDSGATNS